jgi:hypothetical protein
MDIKVMKLEDAGCRPDKCSSCKKLHYSFSGCIFFVNQQRRLLVEGSLVSTAWHAFGSRMRKIICDVSAETLSKHAIRVVVRLGNGAGASSGRRFLMQPNEC